MRRAVLGIVLDGLGFGGDGAIWGGEFLLADYRGFERLGTFKPVAMPGGAQAAREPWRNLYAHLMAEMGWAELTMNFGSLELLTDLERRPRATLDAMRAGGVNAPLASSCGRLFDAVAAALGLCRERQAYEGEAGARLEAIVDREAMLGEDEDSSLSLRHPKLRRFGTALYRAAGDVARLARRSHPEHSGAADGRALPQGSGQSDRRRWPRSLPAATPPTARASTRSRFRAAASRIAILFEEVARGLEAEQFTVLSHAHVPANDGGLALGQAAIGAARLIATPEPTAKSRNDRYVSRHSRPHRNDRRRLAQARDRRCQRRQAARSTSPASSSEDHPVASCVGDWVLVHVGFAMSRIDEAEAAETLQILTELGEAQAEIEAMRLSAVQ